MSNTKNSLKSTMPKLFRSFRTQESSVGDASWWGWRLVWLRWQDGVEGTLCLLYFSRSGLQCPATGSSKVDPHFLSKFRACRRLATQRLATHHNKATHQSQGVNRDIPLSKHPRVTLHNQVDTRPSLVDIPSKAILHNRAMVRSFDLYSD